MASIFLNEMGGAEVISWVWVAGQWEMGGAAMKLLSLEMKTTVYQSSQARLRALLKVVTEF